VRLEGAPPPEAVLLEEGVHVVADGAHGERHDGRGEALGGRDDVGNDALVVLEAPHLAGSAEPDHDLVDVEEDFVLVAEGADALHVAVGKEEDASGSRNALHHDGSDGVRSFHNDLLLEHEQGGCGALLLRRAGELEHVGRGVPALDKVGSGSGLEPAAVSRGVGGRVRAAVVRAVEGHDLLLARVPPRHGDRGLVGLGAGRRERDPGQTLGKDLADELAQAGSRLGHAEAAVNEGHAVQLLVNGGLHPGRDSLPTVGADGLGRPVHPLLAGGVVQVHARASDHDGEVCKQIVEERKTER